LSKLFLFFLVGAWNIDHQQPFEPGAHFFSFAECVQAHNQVEADVEVSGVVHDVLVHFDGFAETLLLDEGECDVALNLELHLLVLVGGAVEGHVVHFYGLIVLLLLKKDVAHIDSESAGLGVLLVLQNNCVTVECLGVEAVGMVLVGQVVEHVECQVNVHLIESSLCLAQLADLFLLRGSFLCLHQGFIKIFLHFKCCGLFEKTVYFFLHFFEILFFGLLLFFFKNAWLLLRKHAFRLGFRLETGGSVGFHSGSETLLSGSNGLAASTDCASLITARWRFGLNN
jgi:hypothetical protein